MTQCLLLDLFPGRLPGAGREQGDEECRDTGCEREAQRGVDWVLLNHSLLHFHSLGSITEWGPFTLVGPYFLGSGDRLKAESSRTDLDTIQKERQRQRPSHPVLLVKPLKRVKSPMYLIGLSSQASQNFIYPAAEKASTAQMSLGLSTVLAFSLQSLHPQD